MGGIGGTGICWFDLLAPKERGSHDAAVHTEHEGEDGIAFLSLIARRCRRGHRQEWLVAKLYRQDQPRR